MENGVEQSLETRSMLHTIHPALSNQDVCCPKIKWTEAPSGEGEWKCLEQERSGVASILRISEEREKIPQENIDYLIYHQCNCSNHKSCDYLSNRKAG